MTSALPVLAVPRLVLWRHGRTEWNATGRFQGQLDPPLDEVGRSQAACAAPHLVAAGLPPEDTVVVSSDLSRAAETAATLTALLGVPLRLDARLREHGWAAGRGSPATRWPSGTPSSSPTGWPAGPCGAAAVRTRPTSPSGPSPRWPTCRRRRVAVVVTHGGTAGRLLETAARARPRPPSRASVRWATARGASSPSQGGRWRLLRHNSSALQPPADGAARARAAPSGARPAGRRRAE